MTIRRRAATPPPLTNGAESALREQLDALAEQ
jgi:hypothetical protein